MYLRGTTSNETVADNGGVEAPASDHSAPRRGDAGDPWDDPVARGDGLVWLVAVVPGVEGHPAHPGSDLHLSWTPADDRHDPVVRDDWQWHPRSLGAATEARGPGRLPARTQ